MVIKYLVDEKKLLFNAIIVSDFNVALILKNCFEREKVRVSVILRLTIVLMSAFFFVNIFISTFTTAIPTAAFFPH